MYPSYNFCGQDHLHKVAQDRPSTKGDYGFRRTAPAQLTGS